MMNLAIRPATIEDTKTIVRFNVEMALESGNLLLDPKIVREAGVLST